MRANFHREEGTGYEAGVRSLISLMHKLNYNTIPTMLRHRFTGLKHFHPRLEISPMKKS